MTKLILTKVENNDIKPKTKQSIVIGAGGNGEGGEISTTATPSQDSASWSSYCNC